VEKGRKGGGGGSGEKALGVQCDNPGQTISYTPFFGENLGRGPPPTRAK